ncbi:hypothetical protein KEM55_004514 [Ascosphaera atra]|nr:hypothetical protein KEM55_004514 [Ascosphaera atra]
MTLPGMPRRRTSRTSSRDTRRDFMSPTRTDYSRSHRASVMTGRTGFSSEGYTETSRKAMSDAMSVDTDPAYRSSGLFRPIPAPIISIKGEFPTISRSLQQQAFTCLVSIEVPATGWTLDERDLEQLLPPAGVPIVEEAQEHEDLSVPPPQVPPLTDEPVQILDEIAGDLTSRVVHWHNLDYRRFGRLLHWGMIGVSKDKKVWQVLECYLFEQMLICVRERRNHHEPHAPEITEDGTVVNRKNTKCKLKGSILLKKHLQAVEPFPEEPILHLHLSAPDVPSFYLLFHSQSDMHVWKNALIDLTNPQIITRTTQQFMDSIIDEGYRASDPRLELPPSLAVKRLSNTSSHKRASTNADSLPAHVHVPLDIVIVVSMYQSMHGIKLTVLKDTLRFMLANFGEHDRLSIVTFGSAAGPVVHTELRKRDWLGWEDDISALRPAAQKNLRGDLLDATNIAIDLLMSRTFRNPLTQIFLISDSNLPEPESIDFVVSRAEASKVGIYSFGYGMSHKPETMIELSTRTKAAYTFVKDWMMLRECLAGCLGALQTTSHQNVKVKLRLPEGSPAKFFKISGALQTTKRASGKEADALLGDLKFGEKRDILLQLNILPESPEEDSFSHDAWESLRSNLESLGGPLLDDNEQRIASVEEVPLVQADLTYGDILRGGHFARVPRPSLLTITMLPSTEKTREAACSLHSPIPPHPAIIQRRMELLTSDMLSRALTLATRGQTDNAHTLLTQTQTILKGLGKGGLPQRPTQSSMHHSSTTNGTSKNADVRNSTATQDSTVSSGSDGLSVASGAVTGRPSGSDYSASGTNSMMSVSVDSTILNALDRELEVALEWMGHPVMFNRDSRKSTFQAIGVISSQRAFTYRTPVERLFAERIEGVRRLMELSELWRSNGEVTLAEE